MLGSYCRAGLYTLKLKKRTISSAIDVQSTDGDGACRGRVYSTRGKLRFIHPRDDLLRMHTDANVALSDKCPSSEIGKLTLCPTCMESSSVSMYTNQ